MVNEDQFERFLDVVEPYILAVTPEIMWGMTSIIWIGVIYFALGCPVLSMGQKAKAEEDVEEGKATEKQSLDIRV